jgi:hypothetical protein
MDEETFTELSRQKANPWVEKSSKKRASEVFEELRAKLANTKPVTTDEEEILHSPEKLRDLLEIPNDAMEVVGAYSAVLAEGRRLLKPLSALPYPKTRIEEALQIAMHNARDPGTLRNLEIALDVLKDFIPDSDVPADPEENTKAWFAHRAGQRP